MRYGKGVSILARATRVGATAMSLGWKAGARGHVVSAHRLLQTFLLRTVWIRYGRITSTHVSNTRNGVTAIRIGWQVRGGAGATEPVVDAVQQSRVTKMALNLNL